MASHGSNRIRKKDFEKAFSRETRYLLSNKIQEIKGSKQGLSNRFLTRVLCDQPSFIGVFPQDYLLHVSFISFPVSLILNLDVSSQPGSHWIALYITQNSLEIYDSLGLDPTTWTRKPVILLKFIEKMSKNRETIITPRFQSDYSNLCGVYSILFLTLRNNYTFQNLCHLFSRDFNLNDTVLLSFFQ